jgi:hypothetical protein
MSCEYCKHESLAYNHVKDEDGNDLYIRVAKPMPYDDCNIDDPEPVLSWPKPEIIDWADHKPRLCVSVYDQDGDEVCVAIPVNFCPQCGRLLVVTDEEVSV